MNNHECYSLLPFAEFAYRVTGDDNWFKKMPKKMANLYFINDKFKRWGIRFIHLNSVMEQNCIWPIKKSLKSHVIDNLQKESVSSKDDEFTILLSHNGPDDLGYILSLSHPESLTALFSLVNSIGGNLLLHGHRHKIERLYQRQFEGEFTADIRYYQTSTLCLNNIPMPESARRGFSIFEFERKNGKIISYKHRTFELDEQKPEEISKGSNVIL